MKGVTRPEGLPRTLIAQGHHPDILLAWGKVEITTWTHKINGLTESDFILAAKIDQLDKS
jgi:4a-hydroxytetrahydrobiopterin dehydratase